jgi:hypothetical protein
MVFLDYRHFGICGTGIEPTQLSRNHLFVKRLYGVLRGVFPRDFVPPQREIIPERVELPWCGGEDKIHCDKLLAPRLMR